MEAIQEISDEAKHLLGGAEIERSQLVSRLEVRVLVTCEIVSDEQLLIRDNHAHLVSLGVSHPSLEMIVASTNSDPYKLATKLTGAGGGGCALTLIPDSESTVHG
jgi:mevalonate kinase